MRNSCRRPRLRDSEVPVYHKWLFSMDERKIDDVTSALCGAGVNDVLLSVDAFHQEYIPLEPVELFTESLLRHSVPSLRDIY